MGLILEGNRSWKNFPKKLSLSVAWVTYSALIGPIVDFVKDILYMLEREELGRKRSKISKNLDDNPWEVYLSILCISFIVSPFFHKQRISEEFKKSCWRGFLQLFCSLPILSELYNYPLLLKNTINTGFHEKEIEAEADVEKEDNENEEEGELIIDDQVDEVEEDKPPTTDLASISNIPSFTICCLGETDFKSLTRVLKPSNCEALGIPQPSASGSNSIFL